MDRALPWCQKCNIPHRLVHNFKTCGHTICRGCLPNLDRCPLPSKKMPRTEDATGYTRRGVMLETSESTTPDDSSPQMRGRSQTHPSQSLNPAPGDCPACQQIILYGNQQTVTKATSFLEFDWVKDVHDKMNPKICSECPDGVREEAKYLCLQCWKDLCRECQKLHCQTNSGHTPIATDDIARSNGPFKIVRRFDPLHCTKYPNQKLVYYCGQCYRAVCELCKDGHLEKGHVIIRLDEALPTMGKYNDQKLTTIDKVKMSLQTEQRKLRRETVDETVVNLKTICQQAVTSIEQGVAMATAALNKFKMAAADKFNADGAGEELDTLQGLKRAYTIFEEAERIGVCSHEERIIRLHTFLRANQQLLDETVAYSELLEKRTARQIPDPVISPSEHLTALVAARPDVVIRITEKRKLRQICCLDENGHRRFMPSSLGGATGEDAILIPAVDINNNKLKLFKMTTTMTSSEPVLLWETSLSNWKRVKVIKSAWINQDQKTGTFFDQDGAICDFYTNSGRRKSTTIGYDVTFCHGAPGLPRDHGYDLPAFLDAKGIETHHVTGRVGLNQSTFLVTGLHKGDKRTVILVSRKKVLEMTVITLSDDRPCRACVDLEDYIYLVDTNNNSISRYNPDGRMCTVVLDQSDQVTRPTDVTVDAQYMYVTEESGKVKVFMKPETYLEPGTIPETVS